MNNSNRLVICIRDRSCGAGGVHCDCCNPTVGKDRSKARTAFSRLVRTRTKNFINRDLARNPF